MAYFYNTIRLAVAGLSAFLLSACSAPADSAEPASPAHLSFDTSVLKGPATGKPNQVMVLGTAHLQALPDDFDAEALNPLLDRLVAWEPDRIAVEAQPGPLCHYMRDFASRHEASADRYCFDPARAGEITGLSVPEATAELDRMIKDGIGAPSPGERRRLVALFLSAGERDSALLHWLSLPEAERKADQAFDAVLVTMVEALLARRGENVMIAAPLAARLGHVSITPMDNQATYFRSPSSLSRDAYGDAIAAAWDNEACTKRLPMINDAVAGATDAAGVDAMYVALNAPGMARSAFDCDTGAAMNEPSDGRHGRRYLAYWETRNLRMAANIREAMGEDPGGKTLVIVGATHKFYLEHYLDQMHDVEVVSTNLVLPIPE